MSETHSILSRYSGINRRCKMTVGPPDDPQNLWKRITLALLLVSILTAILVPTGLAEKGRNTHEQCPKTFEPGGPSITNVTITPQYPTRLDTLNISADVTDPDGISVVQIEYCSDQTCFLPVWMVNIPPSRYYGTIGMSGFSPGTTLHINISATDNLGKNSIAGVYTVTVRNLPGSLNVTLYLNRSMCAPGERLSANGTVSYDNGAPVSQVNVTLSISGVSVKWITVTEGDGRYILNFSAPSKDGKYNLTVTVRVGNFTGIATVSLWVTSEPKAPDFEMTDIDGNAFSISSYRGKKTLLLDFMSLPCTSCKKIETALISVYPGYKDRDVAFISIDILPTDTDSDLRAHRDAKNITWRVTKAAPGMIESYGISEIPVLVVINRNGYITYMEKGILSQDDSQREKIIKEQLEEALKGGEIVRPPLETGLVILAMAMGVAAFFSPCSFPLLPGYVSYYLGIRKTDAAGPVKDESADAKKKRKKAVRKSSIRFAVKGGTASAMGLLVVFVVVGALVILLGNMLVGYIKHMDLVVGILLLILGILTLTNLQYYRIINPISSGFDRIKSRLRKKKDDNKTSGTGPQSPRKASGLSLFGYGMGYGAASLGCTLPVFIAILVAGIGSGGIFNGAMILLAFALSASVLMIAITLLVAGFEMAVMQKLKAATPYIKKASGIILIAVGIYLLYYYWTVARFI
jgi:cytochrome c-type biogenesis protein